MLCGIGHWALRRRSHLNHTIGATPPFKLSSFSQLQLLLQMPAMFQQQWSTDMSCARDPATQQVKPSFECGHRQK